MPIACPADAEGCTDTGPVQLFPGLDLITAGGLLLLVVVAVVVAVVLIRRKK